PGTVGAAPIQNIGAYGLEVAERFHSLEACDMQTGELVRFAHDNCRFGYRDSLFKQQGWHLNARFVITEVTFRLPKVWQPLIRYADIPAELKARGVVEPTARQMAEAIVAIRQRKLPDPRQLPNAGSFFHNPVIDAATAQRLSAAYPGLPCYPQPDGRMKIAAGWLIEQSGWKGKRLGTVGMYENQALILVNHGGATGGDVAQLMRAVQQDVREKFAVGLTPEPIFLGCP
ncbi:MAG: UDP-N-acetylmuramate dehydrogenase, partial [Betaproteobacteria bacterium]